MASTASVTSHYKPIKNGGRDGIFKKEEHTGGNKQTANFNSLQMRGEELTEALRAAGKAVTNVKWKCCCCRRAAGRGTITSHSKPVIADQRACDTRTFPLSI